MCVRGVSRGPRRQAAECGSATPLLTTATTTTATAAAIATASRDAAAHPVRLHLLRQPVAHHLGQHVRAGLRQEPHRVLRRVRAGRVDAGADGLEVLDERIPYGPVRRLRFLTAGRALPPATAMGALRGQSLPWPHRSLQ